MTSKNRIILIQGTDVTIRDQGERLHFPDRYAEGQEWAQSSAISPGKAVRNDHARISQEAASKGIG
ncbi:MAG: hypothetical protein KKC76_13935 [Proteobacteria bacterium]|nr:hypothetical protein [Pseudomonadota bacterium]MBU4294450.1 hypothetical protein [Pseudomonadota bacterium]MCG2749844.1 hypothetical protein [Desulfobulbaceae bacterium]